MACFWNILFCFRTYHYALDISEREVGQTCFRRGVTTRSENGQGRPRQSREGRAFRRVQETARRQVDLSSSCLKHGSKPGLTRTLRLLSCNLRIILHVFYKTVIYTPGMFCTRGDNRNKKQDHTKKGMHNLVARNLGTIVKHSTRVSWTKHLELMSYS